MGLLPLLDRLAIATPERSREILNVAIGHENDAFRENVGPGANAVPRLNSRISEVERVFSENLPR
jgi:hypothetical protein